MKLIIPMAGKGTRLRPHTHTTPKPLLPVAGSMIIERIIKTFRRTVDRDFDKIVFILGDFGDDVKKELSEMSKRYGAEAIFRKQDQALGTAHAVYCAGEDLDGEVIIVFADTLFDTRDKVDLGDADSVIWLKEVEDPSRFGVAVHEGDLITDFVEKPSEPISNLAIIGVYYFKEARYLKKEIEYLLEHHIVGHGDEFQLTDALDRLLKNHKTFKVATVDEWLDCGTIPAWLETSGVILKKEHHVYDEQSFPATTIKPPVFIGEGVTINNSVIGPNATIDAGSSITDSTIKNTIILKQSTIVNSKLTDATIGSHASVRNYCGEAHLGDHSSVVASKS